MTKPEILALVELSDEIAPALDQAHAANAAFVMRSMAAALKQMLDERDRLEGERAEQWQLRRDAEGSRDVAKAAASELLDQRDRLAEALRQCAAPYFWHADEFRPDASTPAHREQEIYRRQDIARAALAPAGGE